MPKEVTQIPKSHRNEWKSKRNFEDILDGMGMYMPYDWSIRDYGLDGQVELTRPIPNSDSLRPESKFFQIQLKSTEKTKFTNNTISYPIPVHKIIQWYSANLPIMFVLNDMPNNHFYSIWIDDSLIGELDSMNPNWVSQKSITIKIPTHRNFTNHTIDTIRDYVLSWRTPSKKIIEPGDYFELKEKCYELLQSYSEIAKPFRFNSINSALEMLNLQVEQAMYRIAITGPSRVGKSTFINTLLRRKNVSPTGMEQTTAVPIQIVPSKEDIVKISFKNGTEIIRPFSPEIIRQYASQEHNEDNKQGVSLVNIGLVNRQLENGISIFDIPGLDDPDDDIATYTWNTASKANAIIYLIDASPYENGGYIFRGDIKKHLQELGQSLDKIFLVFNKVNALTGNKLENLKTRVQKDLEKYNLFEKVSSKIYYVSAEESLNYRLQNKKKKKQTDPFDKLENDIWSYLLKENKIGLVKLSLVNKEILASIKDFDGILNARLMNSAKRKKLEEAIAKTNSKIPQLSTVYRVRENEMKKGITNSLDNRKYRQLADLETYLKSIPIDEELPTKDKLAHMLTKGGYKILDDTNIEYLHQLTLLKELIDNWIEENLKLVREIVASPPGKKLVDFTSLRSVEVPSIDLSSSFGAGLLAGLAGLILTGPIGVAIGGLSAFFGNLIFSASGRRAKRINKIMEGATKQYNEQIIKINSAYMDLIKDNSNMIITYANKKINLYFSDLQSQSSNLENITLTEENQYAIAFEQLKDLKAKIELVNTEINLHYASIDIDLKN